MHDNPQSGGEDDFDEDFESKFCHSVEEKKRANENVRGTSYYEAQSKRQLENLKKGLMIAFVAILSVFVGAAIIAAFLGSPDKEEPEL
mmetsp:Transcript_33848/g.49763  ORF Transcript_33848/g.49763 Transcript_33848/m.49763 type:complete len:88 (+) Transcript_33848:59-322(+)|eukprot:CAMPEP_0195518160 /NCGR_PEP_ID=MMETSP0794_2-20130614/12411_1 /TAXON_ID=515487 /ORGANISM="Stephanopyxis turris, Strain CCMP 815" /LENGTH=87 /DNA_ID=CAMNT_0040647081 /DNA_START=32 /DNA_END=298 /DNA_ORIENTATION=+